MVKVEEQALVEKLVAHAAVEALAEAVLHWLSWRNEVPDDPVVLRPGEHGVRGELGPVVGHDHAGFAAALDQDSQFARHAPPRDRRVGAQTSREASCPNDRTPDRIAAGLEARLRPQVLGAAPRASRRPPRGKDRPNTG